MDAILFILLFSSTQCVLTVPHSFLPSQLLSVIKHNLSHSMAHNTVKVIDKFQVSPPPGSVPSTSLPLTFFDLPWLCCPPIKRIFFYDFPHSTHHFFQTVLPTLKHSLSLSLQHFFPFSANVAFPPKPHAPHIVYSDGDSIPFTVAESTADFTHLVSDSSRDVTDLHPFVPVLASPRTLEDGTRLIPTMAIQVTVLPNSGFAICLTFKHAVADGRAFHHFMKFWASISREIIGHSESDPRALSIFPVSKTKVDLASLEGMLAFPLHKRDIIEDPNGLKPIFLEDLWNSPLESIESRGIVRDVPTDMVRRTFVLSRDRVEKLKKLMSNKCKNYSLGTLHVSSFVVACSLIWVCKVKSEETEVGDELYLLTFMIDCRNHREFSLIPSTYFGNCLGCGNAAVKRSKLVGENGIFEAAIAIGSQVRYLQQCEASKGAEILMSNFREFATLGQHMVIIAGSTKLDVYETDFGRGKPRMSEVVHVDNSTSISLSDCREKEGGIEVGLALGRTQMKKFNTILEEQLTEIAVHD